MKHHYVNRASRLDRNFLFRGAMAAQGVPADALRLHVARDKLDYPDAAALCEEAMKEFPEFFGFHLTKPQLHIGFGHLICSWSIMRMWQEIADGDSTEAAWVDDYALKVPEFRLHQLVDAIEPDILMLAWHRRDDIFVMNYFNFPIQYQLPERVPISKAHRGVFEGALGGSDWALVLSPRGAGWLLDYMSRAPYFNTELAPAAFYFETRSEGVFTVRGNNPAETGEDIMRENRWVLHLCEYTTGAMSDLGGLHLSEVTHTPVMREGTG